MYYNNKHFKNIIFFSNTVALWSDEVRTFKALTCSDPAFFIRWGLVIAPNQHDAYPSFMFPVINF